MCRPSAYALANLDPDCIASVPTASCVIGCVDPGGRASTAAATCGGRAARDSSSAERAMAWALVGI